MQHSINETMKKIILIVVLLAMAGWYYFNTNPNASIGATLSYVEGAVEYKKDSDDWKRAEANTDLFEGNEIEIVNEFGGMEKYKQAIEQLQTLLYAEAA